MCRASWLVGPCRPSSHKWSHLQPPASKLPDLPGLCQVKWQQYPLFQQLQEPEQS